MFYLSQNKKPPSNEIYNVSNLMFTNKNIHSSLTNQYCLYHLKGDTFCIILTKQTKQENITKEIINKISNYAQTLNIYNIVVLLEKSITEYAKLFQDLKLIGFNTDSSVKKISLWNRTFKIFVLKYEEKDFKDIEDIDF